MAAHELATAEHQHAHRRLDLSGKHWLFYIFDLASLILRTVTAEQHRVSRAPLKFFHRSRSTGGIASAER